MDERVTTLKTIDNLEPIWQPTDEIIRNSNIQSWCNELGLSDYRQLHDWSVANRERFWAKAIERLGIRLESTGSCVLSNSSDPAHAVWFPEARMNIVASCFQAMADDTAIVSQVPGQELQRTSYGQLLSLTNRVANSIVAAGFVPGDRLAVVLPMTKMSVPIYLGIVAAGCAVVSIADSFAAPEIATRLEIAEAKAVFTYDAILRAGKSLPLYPRVVEATEVPIITLASGDQLSVNLRDQDLAWNEFFVTLDQFELQVCSSNDCVNVLFSSGTTGDPKAVVWNHLTPLRCGIDGHIHQDLKPGDVVVWPTNLGWMMGPWLIFAALLNKATIGLYEDAPMGEGFGRFVEAAKVNMLGVVPTIVTNWRNTRAMEACDWSSIKCFSSTGETSQPQDMIYLSNLAGSKPIIEYCGGTEIGGGYMTSTVVQPNVPSAFTTPTIGLDFVLLNAQNEVADEGEVYLIPPSIGLSNQLLKRDHFETYYAGLPSGPRGETLRKHGDHFKKHGDYYVAGGRTDDTMNLGGIKISSAELERVLNQLAEVHETAAVAVSEDHGPDRLVVFAVLEQNPAVLDQDSAALEQASDASSLITKMNQRLKTELNPLFKVGQVEVIDTMPRTASNKIMRRKLRAQLVDQATKD